MTKNGLSQNPMQKLFS